MVTDWHLVHLGSRAVGGAGLVMAEATAVAADGRISPSDAGIWSDAHVDPLARCARFIEEQGAVAAIQLAHAGRKASVAAPWEGDRVLSEDEGGWRPIWAPSPIAFAETSPIPTALSTQQITRIVDSFSDAAQRALDAGFRVVEIHSAHGYLLHEFLSPLSNHRNDEYGGSFGNRTRLIRRWSRPFVPFGRTICRCSSEYQPQIGWKKAGMSNNRWNWPGRSNPWGWIWLIAPRGRCCRTSGCRSSRAIKCRLQNRFDAKRTSRRLPWD